MDRLKYIVGEVIGWGGTLFLLYLFWLIFGGVEPTIYYAEQ